MEPPTKMISWMFDLLILESGAKVERNSNWLRMVLRAENTCMGLLRRFEPAGLELNQG